MTNPSADELASQPIDAIDLDVLGRIGGLYTQLDSVPNGLIDRIQFGITLDALHGEIAELQRSSDLVGVRAEASDTAYTVTFTSASLTTMVTITVISAERARIDGWIAPGAGVSVELRTSDGVTTVTADDDGRFAFEEARRGMAQFVIRQPGDSDTAPVLTPTIEI